MHTFSISVSSPDCVRLHFRQRCPQRLPEGAGVGGAGGVKDAQFYRTALLVKGFQKKTEIKAFVNYYFFFFTRNFLICIFRPKVVGVAWTELIPLYWSPPAGGGGGGDGLASSRFVFIFSTSKLYKNMQHTSWPKSMWN